MADVKKTIEILFQGTDKMSSTVGTLSKKLGTFADSAQSATQPLADMADAIVKVDVVLAALAVGGIAVAINEAGKFGDSFAEITTLITATDSELLKFKGSILAYSRDSTAGIDDINSAIYTAISAGIDYGDSLDLLNQTEQLSVAGKADLESATRVLVSSLNAYGMSVDEAESFSDALFTTVEKGQTTLPELANSLAQVSTIAAKGGVTFDTLMAAIAAVTATGAPTTQAITAIKASIAAIIKPSSEATKEAAKLGIQFDASALATKGLDGVLKDVYQATGGATDQITKLFGSVESLPAVLTLGADTSGRFADALEAMANKAGATEGAYKKMADNFNLTNQNLANNIKATFIQIGDELLDSYLGIVGEISEVFKSLGQGIDAGAFDDLFDVLNLAGEDIEKFFGDLALSLPEALGKIDWSGFISALEEIGVSIGGIFEDFDPSDPDQVAEALQFVVDSLESLIRVSEGMIVPAKAVILEILDWIEKFNKLDESTKKTTGEFVAWGKVINVVAGLISPVTGAIEGLSTAMLTLAGVNAGKSILSLGTAITGTKPGLAAFATASGTVTAALGAAGMSGAIGYMVGTVLNDQIPAITTVSQKILGWVDSIVDFTGTQRDANQVLEEEEAYISAVQAAVEGLDGEEAIAKVDVKTTSFESNLEKVNEEMIKWEQEEAQKKIDLEYKEALDAVTIDIRAELDAIDTDLPLFPMIDTDAFYNELVDDIRDAGMTTELEMPFALMYRWTDSEGQEHYSDQPPHPDEDIISGEILHIPISVAVEEKSVERVLDVIEETISDREFILAINTQVGDVLQQVTDVVGYSTEAYGAYAATVEAGYKSTGQILNLGLDKFAAAMNDSARIIQKQKANDLLLEGMEQQLEMQRRDMDLREKIQKANEEHMTKNEDLIDRQIEVLYEHKNALNKHTNVLEEYISGDKQIEIDISGVEPEVEAIIWKILKAIQVRANESGAEFLLAATG